MIIGCLGFIAYQPFWGIWCQILVYTYDFKTHSLYITFLNETELICLHTVKRLYTWFVSQYFVGISCLNFWDEACWFLSLRVFGLLSSYPLAFFRCLSNSGTFTELWTASFIESTGVACSDSVSHNWVLSIPVLLLVCSEDWTCFPKRLRRQSSEGFRFNPHYRRVTIQEYLTLVSGYG